MDHIQKQEILTYFTLGIVIFTIFLAEIAIYILSGGANVVITHLFYFPIIFAAYRYPKRGALLSTGISLLYLFIIYPLVNNDPTQVIPATMQFYVYVSVGIAISFVSGTLRLNEMKYRSVFDKSGIGICLSNATTGELIESNPHCDNILGKDRDLDGEVSVDQLWADDKERRRFFAALRAEGTVSDYETYVEGKGGEPYNLLVSARLLPDEDMVVFTMADITDRKQAENALVKSTERLNLAIEGANLGVWDRNLVTDEGIYNKRWAEMLGYSNNELRADFAFWSELIHPDDREHVFRIREEHLRGNTEFYQAEYRIRCKDGEWKWVSALGKVAEWDNNARPIRMTGIHMDITEMRRYQNSLQEANKKLSILSSITRHDILNQITGIVGYMGLIKEMNPENETTRVYMDRIMELTDTIQRQITFTRDYENMGVKEPEWQPLEYVVQQAADSLPTGSVQIIVNTGHIEVFADHLLEKVFYNILENSLRHGGNVRSIRITFREENEYGLIILEDDGIGVPSPMKTRIFKQGVGKNTGYGLFLTTEILGITGMSIRENGEEGKGARFEIEVPRGGYRGIPPVSVTPIPPP